MTLTKRWAPNSHIPRCMAVILVKLKIKAVYTKISDYDYNMYNTTKYAFPIQTSHPEHSAIAKTLETKYRK
jgi:hypothetical protein